MMRWNRSVSIQRWGLLHDGGLIGNDDAPFIYASEQEATRAAKLRSSELDGYIVEACQINVRVGLID